MTTIFDFGPNDGEARKAFLAQDAERRAQELRDLISPEAVQARAAAEQAQRAAHEQLIAEQHEAKLRDKIRWSYVAANGSETGFADAYPALRAAHVQAQTLANVDQGGDIVDKFIAKMNGGN
jgi:hypothetical protein